MKKVVSVLGYVLFAITALQPLGVIISDCFNYTFKLSNYSVFAVVSALIAIIEVVLSIVTKHPVKSIAFAVLSSIAMPMSVINAIFYLLESQSVSTIVGMIICSCCCSFLTVKYGRPVALKIIGLAISGVMICFACYAGFVFFIFGGITQNTVVQSVESPNGERYAEVIDSDQGALGGDTFVDVHSNKVDLIVFTICKRPKRVYQGEWGMFQDMQIYWKDDNCLVINNVEYDLE